MAPSAAPTMRPSSVLRSGFVSTGGVAVAAGENSIVYNAGFDTNARQSVFAWFDYSKPTPTIRRSALSPCKDIFFFESCAYYSGLLTGVGTSQDGRSFFSYVYSPSSSICAVQPVDGLPTPAILTAAAYQPAKGEVFAASSHIVPLSVFPNFVPSALVTNGRVNPKTCPP